ncbi:ABC transporter permease [Leucobacter sp. wl10]|uniref:ABC transporter permease n=1 Tax=Leucobacter sp. wl10 TaxID=2304677 RepID=UPI000E5C1EDE|nr:ABC transporter permease [Leucobacter sp. wl10]RGE21579.1 ABC transporter permease [Leucobacter sp. wl10]
MAQRSALRLLAAMSMKDMLRNRLTGLAPMFLFAWLVLIYGVLSFMLSEAASDPATHPLRAALPSILVTGIAGIAFMVTTVPLVSMRERGLLRLFGTTPLRRPIFLLAQLPSRLALIALEVGFIVTLVVVAGFVGDHNNYWRLLGTLIIGTAMLFACAMLLASRSSNTESTHQSMTILVMGVFVFSGTFLPPGTLPAFTEIFTNAIPTTWFAAAISADLTGAAPFLPVLALWVMMLAVTVIAGVLAVRRFEWDHEEAVTHTPPRGQKSAMKEMVS